MGVDEPAAALITALRTSVVSFGGGEVGTRREVVLRAREAAVPESLLGQREGRCRFSV